MPWQPGVGRNPWLQYDLFHPQNDRDHYEFGLGLINCILNKGFCIVKLPLGEKVSNEVVAGLAALSEKGYFSPPPSAVVDGLLGEEGSTRIAGIPTPGPGDDSPLEWMLLEIDARLDVVAKEISRYSKEAFGFSMDTRTPGLLHESGTPTGFFPRISQVDALNWYRIFTSHRIMCLVFLGPESGILELQPLDEDSNFFEVETGPGMCVYLRADHLSHRFRAPEETYTLSCWLLQAPSPSQRLLGKPCFPLSPVAQALDELLTRQPTEEKELAVELESNGKVPRELQRMLHHKQRTGGKTAVRGAACKLPAHMDFWLMYPCLSGGGTDVATEIPLRRWDQHYDPNVNVMSIRAKHKHGGEVEGLDLFDNNKFRISPLEAAVLAPEQRQTLEVGYEVLFCSGMRRAEMEKTATGVYVGATWNEWEYIKAVVSPEQGKCASTNTEAIPASRLSYLLGLKGPSMSLDTEGASSLMAVCKGRDDLHVPKEGWLIDQSLCLGVSFLLSHKVLADHAASGFLSKMGRCLTFDATADGHVLGDACAGLLLAPLSDVLQKQTYDDAEHPVRGLICADGMGNVGRSASLTAPHIATDQQLLRTAIRTGGFSVLDVEAAECHATGQPLCDAVEVEILAKVLRGEEPQEALLLSAVKSCLTHSRAASGISGLLKTLSAQSWGAPPPSLHLHVRSGQMDVVGHPLHFLTETAQFLAARAFCSISSHGLGGSAAHVVAWGSVDDALRPAPQLRPEQTRVDISFWPGGGGELEEDAHPKKAYTIVGSWSSWLQSEEMEEEEPGLFGHTVTLGEHRLERFHIRLDGDPQRVLHPSRPQAPGHSPVYGPSVWAGDLCWAIDGRPGAGSCQSEEDQTGRSGTGTGKGTEEQELELDKAEPGSRFRVLLCVKGKWRTVTWERLHNVDGEDTSPGQPPVLASVSLPIVTVPARYFITASWNMWQLDQEMTAHPRIPGLHRHEVLLLRGIGEFQIVVNRDRDQVLYPREDCAAGSMSQTGQSVHGPDFAMRTRGMNWFIDGRPGDVFRIEYQIAWDYGMLRQAVTFRRIGRQELSDKQLSEAAHTRYFIVGSWNHWRSQEMAWNSDGECFEFELELSGLGSGLEMYEEDPLMFQVLMDNDWRMVLHPEEPDSDSSEIMGPSDLGECHGVNWLITRQGETPHAADGDGNDTGAGACYRYIIRLHTVEELPIHIEWLLIS